MTSHQTQSLHRHSRSYGLLQLAELFDSTDACFSGLSQTPMVFSNINIGSQDMYNCKSCTLTGLGWFFRNHFGTAVIAKPLRDDGEVWQKIYTTHTDTRARLSRNDVLRATRASSLSRRKNYRSVGFADGSSDGRASNWIFGLFAHGGVTGITDVTKERPWLTKLIAGPLKKECPGAPVTLFMISINSMADVHKDIKNLMGSRSILSGLTRCSGGQLRKGNQGLPTSIDNEGKMRGSLPPTPIKTGTFNARLNYCTMPFTGERLVISAWTPTGIKFTSKRTRKSA